MTSKQAQAGKAPLWMTIVFVVLVILVGLLGFGGWTIQREADTLSRGNNQLQEMLFEVDAEATELKARVAEQEAKIAGLEGELEARSSAPAPAAGAAGASTASAATPAPGMQAELAAARSAQAAAEASLRALEASLSEIRAGEAAARSASTVAVREREEALAAASASEGKLVELAAENRRLSQEIAAALGGEAELSKLTAENARLSEALTEAEAERASLRIALDAAIASSSQGSAGAATELEQLLERARASEAATRAELEASRQATDALEHEVAESRSKIAGMQARLASASSAARTDAAPASTNPELERLQAALEAATRERAAAEERRAADQREHHDNMTALDAELSALSAGLTAAQDANDSLAAQKATLLEAASERDTRLAAVEAERAGLEAQMRTAHDQQSAMSARIAELEARVASLSRTDEQSAALRARANRLAATVTVELREAGLGPFNVDVDDDGSVVVRMRDRLLFGTGSAEISPTGEEIIAKLALVLARHDDASIRVEGHADSRPIIGPPHRLYHSNWELSGARATQAARRLADPGGIPAERLSAIGFAYTRPVASNASEDGRRRNRRIELRLTPR